MVLTDEIKAQYKGEGLIKKDDEEADKVKNLNSVPKENQNLSSDPIDQTYGTF